MRLQTSRAKVPFLQGKRAWVAGHSNSIGAALVRRLWRERCDIILTTRTQLDLMRQSDVEVWLRQGRPDVIFLAEQTWLPTPERPADQLHRHLLANLNVLAAARENGIGTVVNLSASGLHPTAAEDPGSIRALARAATVRMTHGYALDRASRFFALVSSGIYGPSTDAELERHDQLYALVKSLSKAAVRGDTLTDVTVGAPTAQYGIVHEDDLADAAVFAAHACNGSEPVHCGQDDRTAPDALVRLVAEIVGYRGALTVRPSADDGGEELPARGLRSLGWRPRYSLREHIRDLHLAWLKRPAGPPARRI